MLSAIYHQMLITPAWFYCGMFFFGAIVGSIGTVSAMDRRGWLSKDFGRKI